jgi:trimethyllysine dioxygenase
MCGAYFGMDEYRSKLAVLNEKFATDRSTGANGIATERSVWNPAL